MIKELRKRHLQIWILWAVLLPVGIIVAYMAVPKKVEQALLQADRLRTEKIILATATRATYSINIRVDTSFNNPSLALEFINKKELTVPSLLLYTETDSSDNIDKQFLLGRIETKGTQFFSLDFYSAIGWGKIRYTGKFILYDFIK